MRIKHVPIEKLKKQVLATIGKHLDLVEYRVFFFGSRVLEKGDEKSDIDIGIKGLEPIPLNIFSKIEEEIESIQTLYSIEIVDFSRVSEKFKKVAMQKVEYLN